MLLCPVIRKLIIALIDAKGARFGPPISIAKILEARGVFVVPERRDMIPSVAKIWLLSPLKIVERIVPDVDPIKKIGFINPPLPPKLRVKDEVIIFKIG